MDDFGARELLDCYARGVFPMADARDDARVFLIDPYIINASAITRKTKTWVGYSGFRCQQLDWLTTIDMSQP